MNRVELIGRLTKDTELKYTKNDMAVATFTIAINRQYKGDSGEQETDYITCKAFGKRAELIGKYCKKGDQVAVEGSIRTGSYEKDGQKHYTTEVVIDNIAFLTPKAKEEKGEEEPPVVITESASDKVFQEFGDGIEYSEDDVAF